MTILFSWLFLLLLSPVNSADKPVSQKNISLEHCTSQLLYVSDIILIIVFEWKTMIVFSVLSRINICSSLLVQFVNKVR